MKYTKIVAMLVVISIINIGSYARGTDESSEVELDVLYYGDNTSKGRKLMEMFITSFETEYPNVTIKGERLFDEAYHQKVQARLQSGDVPDVLYAWASSRSAGLYKSKQAVDLSKYIDTSHYDDLAIKKQVPIEGTKPGLYVLPLSLGVNSVLYVNTALLAELGLNMPHTYQDLVAMVPKAKSAGINLIAMANAPQWVMNSTLFGTITARITGNANWLKEAMEGKHSFTDTKFVEALTFVQRLYEDGVLEKSSLQVDYGASLGAFMNSQAIFMIDGHWRLAPIAEDTKFFQNVEMMVFPALPNESKKLAGTASGEPTPGYTITQTALRDEKVKEAALAFITFIVNEENGLLWAEEQSYIPINKKVDKSNITSPALKKKEAFYASVKGLVNTPDQVLSSPVNEILNNGLQELGLGNTTPSAVAQAMETTARR